MKHKISLILWMIVFMEYLIHSKPKKLSKHFEDCLQNNDCEERLQCQYYRCMTSFEINHLSDLGISNKTICNTTLKCEKNYACINHRCEKINNNNNKIYANKRNNKISESSLKIIMAGDNLVQENVYLSGQMANEKYHLDHLYKHIKPIISKRDIRLINQETLLGGVELGITGKNFSFNSPQELGDAIINAGFNVILHANNHAFDRGEIGIIKTKNFWKSKYPNIPILGISSSINEYKNKNYYIFKKNNIKVGILNYCKYTNQKVPNDKQYLINFLSNETQNKIINDIKKLKAESDFLIVIVHWGREYDFEPSKEQYRWGRFFADNGVDLLIGSHPHVVQTVAHFQGKNGNLMLCFFSLGNFISDQHSSSSLFGILADIKINKNFNTNKIYISYANTIPIITHKVYYSKKYTIYLLKDYMQNLLEENYNIFEDEEFSLSNIKKICTNVLDYFCNI